MALGPKQRSALEELLERERARLVRRLRRRGEELGAGPASAAGYSQHMAEQAAEMTERETAFLMASEEGRRLVQVRKAMDRLVHSPDTFGVCMDCGRNIAFERLEALPYAELCIDCKRKEEDGGGGSRD